MQFAVATPEQREVRPRRPIVSKPRGEPRLAALRGLLVLLATPLAHATAGIAWGWPALVEGRPPSFQTGPASGPCR